MKIYDVLGFILSALLGGVSFFATSNVFIGGGVLVTGIMFYLLLIRKKMQLFLSIHQKIHECYLFINNFLVSLSIKESLPAAFEVTNTAISDQYRDYLASIEDLNPQEKLMYLKKYFPFQIFQLLVDVVLIWLEQGGNILEMSDHISNETREIEEYISYSEMINRRKAIEIAVLWFFSLTIVIALRIALANFYEDLLKQPIYLISNVVLVLVILLSIYLLVIKITKVEVRMNENE